VGGDEFGLILSGAEPSSVQRALQRIRLHLDERSDGVVNLGGSFGSARVPVDGGARPELIAVADERLYEDKRRRRSPGARQT
jgi:GGDEF domain-containing protein